MKLIANCQLRGDYGVVARDQHFETTDDIAAQLLRSGMARRVGPPQVLYETKPIHPTEAPEVRPEVPFRDMHVPDAESKDVASEGDSVLSTSDIPFQSSRTFDPVRRRGRSRFTPSR